MEKQKQWYNVEDLRSQHFKVHDLLQQRLRLIQNVQSTTYATPTTTTSSMILPFPSNSSSSSRISTPILLDEETWITSTNK